MTSEKFTVDVFCTPFMQKVDPTCFDSVRLCHYIASRVGLAAHAKAPTNAFAQFVVRSAREALLRTARPARALNGKTATIEGSGEEMANLVELFLDLELEALGLHARGECATLISRIAPQ